jgi:ubiquinone/menaquinone biosynthesis C-methylase UbiE
MIQGQQPSHKEIYTRYADQYERLVSRSDYQQNILQALNRIESLEQADVVELGAGTGRLTCKLTPLVKSIHAFDASRHMLAVAVAKLKKSGLRNWWVGVADNRRLPLDDRVADIVVSGWSICYTVLWHRETWREELNKALAEMRRVLRPGGTIILLESLGTGYQSPRPPRLLGVYYEFLSRVKGFSSAWIRTDYRFESLAEAEALTRFFFGEDKVEKIAHASPATLPEYTGVWWLRI